MTVFTIPRDGVVVTRTEQVWLGEDGIIRAVIHPGLVTNLDDAKENTRAFTQVSGGQRRLAVIDMRAHAASATRDAREWYAGPGNGEVVLAVALLVRSNVSRMIGNLFLGLNKTVFPLRLFAEPEPALEWLRGLPRT